jgi:prepilin peptidase CpaA
MSLLLIASLIFQGLAILLLGRIAWADFTTQRISNRHVLLLLCLGLGTLQFQSLQGHSWLEMGMSAFGGVALFIALFPFWLLRKVGAGDVKLMSVTPFLVGGSNLAVFSVLLLIFAIVTAAVIKNPFVLPAGMFRQYVQHMEQDGVVPFGVPISAATVCTIMFQMYHAVVVATSSGILEQLN